MVPLETILNKIRKLQKDVCCFRNYGGVSLQDGDGVKTIFTIAHGISGVTENSYVSVIPKSNDALVSSFDVSIDDTEITITYNIPPNSGTENLKWIWFIKP